MAKKGHLECYFACGVSCDSLETLALHIELDHREDNNISPFVIRDESFSAPPGAARAVHAFPSRPPPPVPSRSKEEMALVMADNYRAGSDGPEVDLSIICDQLGCGEQVLLIELNEHYDMHDAERLTLADEPSPRHSSSSAGKHSSSSTGASSISPSNASASSISSHHQNFSITIPDALLRDDKAPRMQSQQQISPRQHMTRKFLGYLGYGEGRPSRMPEDSARLGVCVHFFVSS